MKIFINEPTTQKMPAFYNFMGGFSLIRSMQSLDKFFSAPRHWRGKITVQDESEGEVRIIVKARR